MIFALSESEIMSLSRERQRRREVEEWTSPKIIKKPIYEQYRVEQLIKDHRYMTELPEEPKVYAIPTETVVKKVFSLPLVHTGYRFGIWTKIPTYQQTTVALNVTIPANSEMILSKAVGRGLTRFIALCVDYPDMQFEVWYDGRRDFGFPLSLLYSQYEKVMLPKFGGIVKWDEANSIYSYVTDYEEEFESICYVKVINPDSADHTVRSLIVHYHFHKPVGE